MCLNTKRKTFIFMHLFSSRHSSCKHGSALGLSKTLLLLAVWSLGFAVPAAAQMTDDQIISYVQSATQSGKSQTQIARELMAKGVSMNQLQRLQSQYGGGRQSSGSGTMGNHRNSATRNRDNGYSQTDSRLRRRSGSIKDRRLDVAERDRLPGFYDGQNAEEIHRDNERLGADYAAEGSLLAGADSLKSDRKRSVPDSLQLFGHNLFSERALTFEPNENLATPEDYTLGPGDEVIIDIWGANEDFVRQEISPEGNIVVEQLGPIHLNGLTVREANDKIRRIFARKYESIAGEEPMSDIRLSLGELRSIQVNIMGEVNTPGTYRISSFASLFHALYYAGGVTDIGSLRNIRVVRNGKEVATADIYEYLFDGKLSNDLRLKEGDVIIVPPYEAQVTVQGRVKRPMYYEVKQGEPVGALLEYAGGFAGDAHTTEVGVIRKSGRERQFFNVEEGRYGSFGLENGDSVRVGATLERFSNRVEVEGAVYRPGMYELSDAVNTVRKLVLRADGLKENAFRNRAQLLREKEDLTKEMLAIDLQGIMAGTVPDVRLRRNDVLIVPSLDDMRELGDLTIEGEVAWPGVYPFAEQMTVEDLIVLAGGLLESASTAKVDVSRRVKSPGSRTPSKEIGRIYTFSIKDGFLVERDSVFTLEPFDVVEVRRSPSYQSQRMVTIEGEVAFAGRYALARKNERISDLVERAGGVTEDAYVRGGRLIRRMNDDERAVREAMIRAARQNRGSDSVSVARLEISDDYTVGIDLDKALANPGSDYDVVLREGDRLVVPEYVSTVTINGEVMNPNTVAYHKGKKLKYYIAQAGGYADRAKRKRVYVVYMNGTIAQAKKSVVLEPGCEIVVPSKPKRNPVSLAEIMGLTTSAASLGTMAAAIASISK